MKKANNLETKVVDALVFDAGVAQLKKAVEMESDSKGKEAHEWQRERLRNRRVVGDCQRFSG
jgi:hypothetical protein